MRKIRYLEKIFTKPYVFTSLKIWHCQLCYYFGANKCHFIRHLLSKHSLGKFHWAWYSHWEQEYLIPSCLDCLWVLRNRCALAWYSQWLHEHLTPSCLDCWWVLSWSCRVAWYSHWLHEYLTPSFLDCWWVLILPCNVAWYSHWLQEYLKP